jgi:phosphopantothenate-cysteine ligase
MPLLLRVLRENKRVKQLGILHTVTFVTVDDYLFLLRGIAGILSAGGKEGVGRDAIFYLAAAVSDFFLPRQKLVHISLIA